MKGCALSSARAEFLVDIGDYKLWEFCNVSVKQLCEKQTFHGVQLLVPGDRGRVTRSGNKYGYGKDTFSALVKSRYTNYTKYIQDVLDSMQRRFEPWPEWLIPCEEVFNFGTSWSSRKGRRLLKT